MRPDPRAQVDYGMDYLDDVAAAFPALDGALPALYAEAGEYVAVWRLRHEVLLQHAKEAWDANAELRATSEAHRSWGFFFNTLRRSHETFAAFLAPPTGKVARWQRVVLLVTAVVAMLTVQIWLQEQRGTNCCIDAMLLLGCEPIPGTPCRGFTGDCGDLPAQFEAIPGSPLQGWVCTEFPDPAVPLDKLISSLIITSVGIPVKLVLAQMFEDSNRPAGVRRAWLKSAKAGMSWEWAGSEDTQLLIMLSKYSEEMHLLALRYDPVPFPHNPVNPARPFRCELLPMGRLAAPQVLHAPAVGAAPPRRLVARGAEAARRARRRDQRDAFAAGVLRRGRRRRRPGRRRRRVCGQ